VSRVATAESGARPVNELEWARRQLHNIPPDCDLLCLTIPVPVFPLRVLVAKSPFDFSAFWAPPNPPWVVGFGVAERLTANGATRFEQIKHQAQHCWQRLQTRSLCPSPYSQPRFIGGFSFQPGSANEPPWDSFGDAQFVLPRLSYVRTQGQAWLSLNLKLHPQDSPNCLTAVRGPSPMGAPKQQT
jgi:hypothetical protein